MDLPFPQVFRVRQQVDAPMVADVGAAVEKELVSLALDECIAPGQSVAVTAGSRGIANLPTILRAVVEHVRRRRGRPLIVPAMGSHGGGTADGQTALLDGYGVTEQAIGAPIQPDMETDVVGHASDGRPIHVARTALQADHLVIVNRVKPHTRLAGPIQSGLVKMLVVGLGKCEGAAVFHQAIADGRADSFLTEACERILARCPVTAGLAIVENVRDETAHIEGLRPESFAAREPELLRMARGWMARLPFDDVDLLLIDRIGKDISGTGLDTNVVGRKFDDHKAVGDERPRVRLIALRGLSPQTHGNANGMGIAEFCRSRLLEQADLTATRLNAITADHVPAAMPPLDYATDRAMLEAALRAAGRGGGRPTADIRLLWIRDTQHLTEVECSSAYLDEVRRRDNLQQLTEPRDLPFDSAGNLPDLVA